MDIQWYNEVKNLTLEEQWNKLFQRKIKERKKDWESLWGKSKKNAFKNSKEIREIMPELIDGLNIKKFTDIGCGDFVWMSEIDFTNVDYLGCDIVSDLIERNKKVFPNKKFEQLNVVEEVPRRSDLIFMRSVLIYLSLEECMKAIDNIKQSKSKYLMASTSVELDHNKDTSCLMMTYKNLMRPPFNFKYPSMLIRQRADINNDQYMGVWRIDEL